MSAQPQIVEVTDAANEEPARTFGGVILAVEDVSLSFGGVSALQGQLWVVADQGDPATDQAKNGEQAGHPTGPPIQAPGRQEEHPRKQQHRPQEPCDRSPAGLSDHVGKT